MDEEDIEEYIKDNELDSNDLRWKHLYDLCDTHEKETYSKFELIIGVN